MGNSPSISKPLPSSPTILVSVSIRPSTLTFPVGSTPKLIITLHNPTTHPVTFRFRQTPLDLPLCFGNGLYSSFWRIDDVTNPARNNDILILTSLPHHSTLGAVPLSTTGEPIAVSVVQEGDLVTVLPGRDGTKLSFDMDVKRGLEAGRKYVFRMQEFELDKGKWCYGNKKSALETMKTDLRQDQEGERRVGGMDELKFRLAREEGAVLETKRSEWFDGNEWNGCTV